LEYGGAVASVLCDRHHGLRLRPAERLAERSCVLPRPPVLPGLAHGQLAARRSAVERRAAKPIRSARPFLSAVGGGGWAGCEWLASGAMPQRCEPRHVSLQPMGGMNVAPLRSDQAGKEGRWCPKNRGQA